MPQYKVIAKGFHDGRLYDPEGKRKTLTTDKPYKKGKLPSWLAEMPKESAGVKKKREAAEKAQSDLDAAKAEEEESKNPASLGTAAAALQQGVSTQEQATVASTVGEGESASFMGEAPAPDSVVETI